MQKITINDIKNHKRKQPLVCIAAYTYPIANLIDKYCDLILVGDSLGMTIYGMENTLDVSVEMMINHAKAVVNATKKSLIVVDLPYGSYDKSKEQALETSRKILKETGCDAVKLEVEENIIPIIEFLVQNDIPVVSHIGLTPQNVEEFGGFKIQGRKEDRAQTIINLAKKSQECGAFCVVIEGVVENIAAKITNLLEIPTIGIGASKECDGQILVIDDILGIKQEYSPKFVKNYSDLSKEIENAVKNYSNEVKNKKFPTSDHCFS